MYNKISIYIDFLARYETNVLDKNLRYLFTFYKIYIQTRHHLEGYTVYMERFMCSHTCTTHSVGYVAVKFVQDCGNAYI